MNAPIVISLSSDIANLSNNATAPSAQCPLHVSCHGEKIAAKRYRVDHVSMDNSVMGFSLLGCV